MLREMKTLTASAAAVMAAATIGAAGCASSGGAGGVTGATAETANFTLPLREFYRCDGGKAYTVQYFGTNRATVTTSTGARYELPATTAASGYAFGGETVSLTVPSLGAGRLEGAADGPFANCAAG